MDLSIHASDVIRLIQAHLSECGLHGACKALREESGILAAGVVVSTAAFKSHAAAGDWGWILEQLSSLATTTMTTTTVLNEILQNVYEMAILELADGGDVALAHATLRLAAPQLDRDVGSSTAATSVRTARTDKDLAETIPKSRQIAQRLAALSAMRQNIETKKQNWQSGSLQQQQQQQQQLLSLPKDYYGPDAITKQQRRDQLGQLLMESIPQVPPSRLTSLLQQAIKWQAYSGQLPVIKQQWPDQEADEKPMLMQLPGEKLNHSNKTKRKFDLVLGETAVVSLKKRSAKTLDGDIAESIPTKVYSTLSFGKRATAEVAVFLPDGTGLVTGSSDGLVEIWSSTSRYKELRLDLPYQQTEELIGHDDSIITAITVSNDGTILATGDAHGLVKVWRIDNGKLLRELAAPGKESISCLDLSHDASHVLVACQSSTCSDYGLRTCRMLKEFRGHTSFINSCRYMITGDAVLRVLTCSADGTARIWDGKSSEMLHVLQPHSQGPSLSRKGMSILQRMDSPIVESCPNLHSAIPLHTPTDSIMLVPRGHCAFMVTLTGVVLQTFSVPVDSILVAASVSPSNKWLYVVTDGGNLHVFDMTTGDEERVVKNFAEATCGGGGGSDTAGCPEITALVHHPQKGIVCAFSNDKSQKRGLLTLWK